MTHVRRPIMILMTVATAVLVAPGTPALAAATCTSADPFQRGVLTPATYTANAKFGAVAVTADFNGDKIADLAVGAPADLAGTLAGGTVSVYLGSASGLGAPRRLSQANLTGSGIEAGDRFGAALAAADFTGDGRAELVIGSPGESIGTTANAGAIGIFRGTATGLEASGIGFNQTQLGGAAEANDQFGATLAAGNFANDGKPELAIGAPGEAPGTATAAAGEVTVANWQTDKFVLGWLLSQSQVASAHEAGDRFGAALAAGNVTGDGKDDLIIGSPGEDITVAGTARVDAGAVSVFPGGATAFGTAFNKNQPGESNESGDNYGSSLAIGDFNKSGVKDIAIGIPGEVVTVNGVNTKSGSVSLALGPVSASSAAWRADVSQTAEEMHNGDRFGAALAVGDVNADATPDLLVGAPGAAKGGLANGGMAVLFPGRATATDSLQPARIIQQRDVLAGSESGDEFGSAVALGDFDGDGRAEGFVGAQGEAVGTNPRAGTGSIVDDLLPAQANRAIETYSPTAALQSAPVGTTLAPIRYAYVDNLGGPKVAVQSDPDNIGSPIWDGTGSLEAVFTGKPAIGQTADGKGVVAVRSTTGEVWIRTQSSADSSAAWGAWVNYGGVGITGITMATLDNGRPAVIGIGGTGELAVLPQATTGKFGAWQGTGIAGLAGDPVAVTVAGGTRIFARDTDGNLHTALYAGLALTGCGPVGDAIIEGSPSVIVYPGSRLRVFATTPDKQIVTIGQDLNGAFDTTWTAVPATGVAGAPAAVLDPITGRITVAARNDDGAIWAATETVQGSNTYGEWAAIGQQNAYTDVTVVPYSGGNGSTYLFTYRDQNNVQRILTVNLEARAALAKAGSVRSFTEKSLPKAGK
jgi:hypothetical protein